MKQINTENSTSATEERKCSMKSVYKYLRINAYANNISFGFFVCVLWMPKYLMNLQIALSVNQCMEWT